MASARTFAKSAPSSRLGMSDTGAAVEKIANVSSSAAKSKLELDKTKKLLGVQQQPAVKVSSSAAKSKLELDKTKKLQQPAVKQQVNYTVNRPSRSDKLNMAHTKTANHDKKVADKRKQGVALHDKTVSQNVDRRASAKPIQLEKKHQAARSKHE